MDFVAVPVGAATSPIAVAPPAPAPAAPASPPTQEPPAAAAPVPAGEAAKGPETTETPEQKAAREAKQEPLSPRFAQLVKKERLLVQRQQEFQRQQAAELAKLEEERKALAGDRDRVSKFEAQRAKAKLDPDGVLREFFGENWYEFLTEHKLSGGKTDPATLLEAARETAKAELEAQRAKDAEASAASQKKAAEEAEAARKAQAEREAQAAAAYRDQLAKELTEAGEKWELVNLYGQHGLVYEVMDELVRNNNLTPRTPQEVATLRDQAAEMVEKYLEGELVKASKTKAFAKYATPVQPAAREEPAPTPAPTLTATPRTLSNQISPVPAFVGEPKSESERLARAMAAMDAALARAARP